MSTDLTTTDERGIARPLTMLETVMRAISAPGNKMTPEVARQYLELGRELQKDQAQAEFNAAFAALKSELPVIDKKGVVLGKAGRVQFKYARYDDVHEALTPLLSRHGFATSFDFEEPDPGRLTVILSLLHSGGHSKQYRWTLPAMGQNQFVSNLQNAAAARSFGKRCVLIDALDVLTKDQDSDGRPVVPPELITADEAQQINELIDSCSTADPKFTERFTKWLKSEFRVDTPAALYRGDQLEAVLSKLKEKRGAA